MHAFDLNLIYSSDKHCDWIVIRSGSGAFQR